jgi:hypothetical protein
MQRYIADSNSALLGLQPEDWLEMASPVNIPGTSTEYPNWRRKLSVTLEQMFADEQVNKLIKDLDKRRKAAQEEIAAISPRVCAAKMSDKKAGRIMRTGLFMRTYTTIPSSRQPTRPQTEIMVSSTDQDLMVSPMVRLKYSLNSQKPGSFT